MNEKHQSVSGGYRACDDGLIREYLRIVFIGAGRSADGQPSTVVGLANSRCYLDGLIGSDRCGSAYYALSFGDVVAVKASIQPAAPQTQSGCGHIDIQSIRLVDPDRITFEALLPKIWVAPAHYPALTLLLQSLNAVRCFHLRRFLVDVLLNANTALGMLNAPASMRHHHAGPGGLLEHTVDMLLDFEEHKPGRLGLIQQDLMRVLIIIHDIGKTVTHVENGYSDRGKWQPHDPAGLELLATPLATLERNAPKLAHLIRATFKPPHYYPKRRHYLHHWLSRLDRRSANRKPVCIESLRKHYHALSG